MIVKNPLLDALFVFLLSFVFTYLLSFLIRFGDHPFIENWLTHFVIATGLTIGLCVFPFIFKKRKT
ncbi:hypothetical protein JCM19047_2278 [Bacillus sp. JCM 19047]|uniref:Uncharacterized protein n=1 Tax=Shouchella miscanthi TaxID=2598861 RepID=A0ABU6NR67_9BACI|nr:hypothetical protein [Shouchella miscanthi]MED4130678.1 hypothetical protein [Shouchella miscanthi]GAF22521.1 hypothetical protein JCM19047_2278 [Bacillus sp. JCM 19047]